MVVSEQPNGKYRFKREKQDIMKDHGISLNPLCPCVQTRCAIWGNCVVCVQNHLEHKRHIPECFQETLRPLVMALAAQMELTTGESRPDNPVGKDFDKAEFLKRFAKRSDTTDTNQ